MIEAALAAMAPRGPRRRGARARPGRRPPRARADGAPAEGARRFRDERRPRAGEAGRKRPPREVAEAIVAALPAGAVRRAGRGRRARVHQRLRDRRSGSTTSCGRIATRGARTGAAPPTGAARPGGVRERQPDRTAHRRARAERRASATRSRGCSTFAGHDVEREYYFNDAGGQMDRFGASVEARYLELVGRPEPFPEDGYHGDYVRDYAGTSWPPRGRGLADLPPEERLRAAPRRRGARRAMDGDPRDARRGSASRSTPSSRRPRSPARGRSTKAIERLRAAGFVYEADGAVWFRSTSFGDDKDRSLIRSQRHAHVLRCRLRVPDRQVLRGFDHLIYVWGADHHGDVVARARRGAGARVRPRRASSSCSTSS